MKHASRAIIISLILTFVLAACGNGTNQPTPTSAPIVINTPVTQPENTVPTVASSELCANLYWPIKDASRWAYTSTGSPVGDYDFGIRVRDLRADGFTVAASFKKTPSQQEWMCTPEGLVPLSLITNNATSILAFRQFQDVRLSNLVGVYLPVNIAPGQTWTFEFDFSGTKVEGGVSEPVTGHIKFEFTAGNNESVSVPGGNYDTLPIRTVVTTDYTITTPAGAEPNNLKSDYTYWFAPNVGWVKASGSGKLGGLEFFETIELTGYAAQ